MAEEGWGGNPGGRTRRATPHIHPGPIRSTTLPMPTTLPKSRAALLPLALLLAGLLPAQPRAQPAPAEGDAADLPSLPALIDAPPPSVSVPGLDPGAVSPSGSPQASAAAAIAGAPGPAPASGKAANGGARIASGPAYEACLALAGTDPAEAARAAATWAAATPAGGDAALHCEALAEIALGRAAIGASMLEQLAATSRAAALARARVEDQAAGVWLGLGRGGHAYGAATMAIALAPKIASFYLDRAIAAGISGNDHGAIADLDHVLALDPRRTDALVLRGVAWQRLGDHARAVADWREAIHRDADGPSGRQARLYLAGK